MNQKRLKKISSFVASMLMLATFQTMAVSPAQAAITQPANYISTQTSTNYDYLGGADLSTALGTDNLGLRNTCESNTGNTALFLFLGLTFSPYDNTCSNSGLGVLHHWSSYMYYPDTGHHLEICEVSNTPVRIKLNGTTVVDDWNQHGFPKSTETAATMQTKSPKPPSETSSPSGWSGMSLMSGLTSSVDNGGGNYSNGYRVDVYSWANTSAAAVGVYFDNSTCNANSTNNIPYTTPNAFAANAPTSYVSGGWTSAATVAPLSANILSATSVGPTGATLNGTVVSGSNSTSSPATTASFIYSTDPTFATGSTTVAATGTFPAASSTPAAATKVLTGLANATVYYYKLAATNSLGTTTSAYGSFTTTGGSSAAPAITSASISGTAEVGQTLTAQSSGVTGTPAPTETYQWKANGTAIVNFSTSSTFVVTSNELGQAITVTITESNGISPTASATSSPTSNVVAHGSTSAPAIASASIAGTAQVGQQLTASATGVTGSPAPTLSYVWYCGSTVITGATAATYTLSTSEFGCAITVAITASNGINPTASASSSATASVTEVSTAPAIASLTISGTAQVGHTLTAVASGVTGFPQPALSYQWYCGSTPISAATSSTYTPSSGDIGCAIHVVATATNGVNPAASATSSSTAAVIAAYTSPTIGGVTFSGTTTVGQTLTASASAVAGYETPTLTYQWFCGADPIVGATGSTYVLTDNEVDCTMSVEITATNSVGSASAASSGSQTVVPANAAPAIGAASISGTAQVGQTLTATATGVTGYPVPALTYQWYCGSTAISGATAATFMPSSNELGCLISVQITATNSISSASASSAATSAVIAASAPAPTSTSPSISNVTIVGVAKVGQILGSTVSGITGSPVPTLTYQWFCGNNAIAGATTGNYTLTKAELNCQITLVVIASNGVLPAGQARSNTVGPVVSNAPVSADGGNTNGGNTNAGDSTVVTGVATFAPGSPLLTAKQVVNLTSLAEKLVGKKAVVVTVLGIATDVHILPSDKLLASNRAKAVVAKLKALGVKATFNITWKVSGSQRISQVTATWTN